MVHVAVTKHLWKCKPCSRSAADSLQLPPARAAASAPSLRSVVVAPPAVPPPSRGLAIEDDSTCSGADGEGWETVGPRRRPRQAPPLLPPRRTPAPSAREAAFRRKLRGLCYRCFSPRHFAKHCRDSIRCLSCRRSGHRAKDCHVHLAVSIDRDIPRPCAPPAARRPGSASTWAAVAAGLDSQPALGPSSSSPPLGQVCGALSLQPQLDRPCSCIHAVEIRAILTDLAASLRTPPFPPPETRSGSPVVQGEDDLCEEVEFGIQVRDDIAAPRLLKEGVDGALAEENERVGPLLLMDHDEVVHCEDVESEEHESQPHEVAGELRTSQESICGQQAEAQAQEMVVCDEVLHAAALSTPACEVVIFDSGTGIIDDDVEAATLGCLLDTDVDDIGDDVALLASSDIARRGVAALFGPPAVPVLPTPLPPTPRAPVALPTPDRRSSRLATKPLLHAEDKAVRLLHKKMGLDFGDLPLEKARKEFANSVKNNPLSDSAIDALRTLFKLNVPSMTAADEALIALAGPGGSDFPPPAGMDVPV